MKTLPLLFRSRILWRHPIALRKNAAHPHTLASMSSVAAAADAPEEFAALEQGEAACWAWWIPQGPTARPRLRFAP